MPEDANKILLCQELELLPMELLTGKRIENEAVRRKCLEVLKGEDGTQIIQRNEKGDIEKMKLSGWKIVTTDRRGNPTDVWIPVEERDNYSDEEIYEMQKQSRLRK